MENEPLRLHASHPDYEELNLLQTMYMVLTNAAITLKYGEGQYPELDREFTADMTLPEIEKGIEEVGAEINKFFEPAPLLFTDFLDQLFIEDDENDRS